MNRILIVEDDPAVAVGLADFVRSLGHEVAVARDGKQALELFDAMHPDLMLLDLVLPHLTGTQICEKIRARGDATPIIMLTAKGQPQDRIDGLDCGADDYVTKPFDLGELAARIRAVLRRAATPPTLTDAVHDIGDVHIDLDRFAIERGGEAFELSTRERDILALLLSRANQVVTRNEILDAVWGTDCFPSTRTVDNYIVSLRRKLEADPASPSVLLSVRGAGYRFVVPDLDR